MESGTQRKEYKVISFDMFQTLVDVNQRIPEIWQGILKEQYTKEKGELGARMLVSNLSEAYQNSLHPFRDMKGMFLECAEKAIAQTGFEVMPEQIVESLMYQHGYAPFYEEAVSVIEELRKEHMVIICSDASHTMINPILSRCKVERVFISDDLECYKGDGAGTFFGHVLKEIMVSPDQVLHIGDSRADITGAKTAGMDACWINRSGKRWMGEEEPDYVIQSLRELL